jgi:hypothetical protein
LSPNQTHFLIGSIFPLRQARGSDYAISMRAPERSMSFQLPSAAMIERQLSDFQYKESGVYDAVRHSVTRGRES